MSLFGSVPFGPLLCSSRPRSTFLWPFFIYFYLFLSIYFFRSFSLDARHVVLPRTPRRAGTAFRTLFRGRESPDFAGCLCRCLYTRTSTALGLVRISRRSQFHCRQYPLVLPPLIRRCPGLSQGQDPIRPTSKARAVRSMVPGS